MQDEAEEPIAETNYPEPTRAEMLLMGAAWAMLVFAVLAGFRLWSGGSD